MAVVRELAEGLLLSLCYCVAYLLVWHLSADQWYLPAGLRAASLLFMPYRRWPFLLAGDAAAMLWLRIPMLETRDYAPIWAYLSPFLLAPAVALAVSAIRRLTPSVMTRNAILPLMALLALWSTLCGMALNATLGGPVASSPMEILLRTWLGSYLGILMFLLPGLLWHRRKESDSRSNFVRDSTLAGLAMAALFCTANVVPEPLLRQVFMVSLVGPAIILTLRYGWRGAAVGALLANLIAALSRSKYGIAAYDPELFSVQLLIAVIATGLFVLGSQLASVYAQAGNHGQVQLEALQFAQASYLAAERTLRNRVVDYSDVNVHINRLRKECVAQLRDRGHHAAAMELTRAGVIESQLLHEYVAGLYPLEIETHGVYQALRSPALARFYDTEIHHALRGNCRNLSLGLQLAAYRCVLNALEMLPQAKRHLVQARAWKGRNAQGVVIRIYADSSLLEVVHRDAPEASNELRTRLKAHGGIFRRRHALVLSFLIAEQTSVTSSV
ncbi:MASE1 domain-containing protein [Xanthomonas vesicatoria]|uniref:MASE1 domain-containing protein n=1 Tax=Xanthomonas vesicatoria TaxID=56460 RepID=UPI001E2B0AB1|nr:MASE1 domain-containing protein [Xanthomonas vesicatoria]MCC8617819.1 MASE1 domain-containing protein [Xanthomonas vesicatoria]MCC8631516.1 MASE1 domain-containing protein [Xanthomonas vesicatoria]